MLTEAKLNSLATVLDKDCVAFSTQSVRLIKQFDGSQSLFELGWALSSIVENNFINSTTQLDQQSQTTVINALAILCEIYPRSKLPSSINHPFFNVFVQTYHKVSDSTETWAMYIAALVSEILVSLGTNIASLSVKEFCAKVDSKAMPEIPKEKLETVLSQSMNLKLPFLSQQSVKPYLMERTSPPDSLTEDSFDVKVLLQSLSVQNDLRPTLLQPAPLLWQPSAPIDSKSLIWMSNSPGLPLELGRNHVLLGKNALKSLFQTSLTESLHPSQEALLLYNLEQNEISSQIKVTPQDLCRLIEMNMNTAIHFFGGLTTNSIEYYREILKLDLSSHILDFMNQITEYSSHTEFWGLAIAKFTSECQQFKDQTIQHRLVSLICNWIQALISKNADLTGSFPEINAFCVSFMGRVQEATDLYKLLNPNNN